MSKAIAEVMELRKDEVVLLKDLASVHDIGKSKIPHDVLYKEEKLNKKEMEIIKNHAIYSEIILHDIQHLSDYADIVRYHHENYDGTGYPDKLSGQSIPLFSRIIAVADNYDALTHHRCYRKKPFSKDEAIDYINMNIYGKFDPVVVRAFNQVCSR